MKSLKLVLAASIILLASDSVHAQHGPQRTFYVYIMNADGSDQRPLFPYPIEARALDVSPDGKRVAYFTSGRGGFEIWVCDIDGSNAVNLTQTDGISESGPRWSPDGTQIAFTRNPNGYNRPNGSAEACVMDADGKNVSILAGHSPSDEFRVWSPDGSRYAFISEKDGTRQIYAMKSDGTGLQNVAISLAEDVYYSHLTWSPDGNRIAYVVYTSGKRHMYVSSISGSASLPLVTTMYRAIHPSWSPDGSLIAFTGSHEGNTGIFVVDTVGRKFVNLTRGVGINEYPAWTPDGRIVYASRRSSDELRLIDRQFLGTATTLTIIGRGDLSFEKRTGDMPPARILQRNSAKRLEYVSLNREEAERILRRLGHTHIKLDEFFGP